MTKLDKLDKKDIFYLILLLIFSIGYFLRLFFPKESLFITPDTYLSDLVHINYSLKFVLSEFLKNNQLPYWSWSTGGGFPLIGESQIGAFYAMNLILFKILPFNFAYNLGYVLTFFIASLGCYLFLRRFSDNKLLTFFSSLFFSYSAPMIVQVIHYNLLQSYSLIPIIFYFLELYLFSNTKKLKIICFLILSLLLTQQFYAGYVMTSFMTFLFIFFYINLRSIIFLKTRFLESIKNAIIFIVSLGSIVGLLSVNQLIPLVEFTKLSVRNIIGSFVSSDNSLRPMMFLTYFKFDFFHTFDSANKSIKSIITFSNFTNIFWDGNLYIGIFPFITSIILSTIFIKKKLVRFIFTLFFLSLLFALGQNSPLNFLYGIPPFSFFRTPYRFNIFMTFFIISIFLVTLDLLEKNYFEDGRKKLIFRISIIIFSLYTITNLVSSTYRFHKTISLEKFNRNIKSQIISKDGNQNVYTFGNEIIWYQTLLHKKWFDEDIYLFLMRDLSPYLNEISKTSSSNIFYASFFAPKNQYYFNNLIRINLIKNFKSKGEIFSAEPVNNYEYFLNNYYKDSFQIPVEVINSFRIKGIKYFITPLNIKEDKNIKKIKEISNKYDNQLYYIRFYEITNTYPNVYITNDYAYINSVNDAILILSRKNNTIPIFGYSNIDIQKGVLINYKVSNYSLNKNQVKFMVESDNPGLLVTTGSYYPGIKVYANDKEVKVNEVNFNQIAFKIEKGKHDILIIYKPDWLIPANLVSIFFHILLLFFIGSIFYITPNKNKHQNFFHRIFRNILL